MYLAVRRLLLFLEYQLDQEVLLALCLALEARELARSWDTDRIAVDLRLGRYGSARARAEGPKGEFGVGVGEAVGLRK